MGNGIHCLQIQIAMRGTFDWIFWIIIFFSLFIPADYAY